MRELDRRALTPARCDVETQLKSNVGFSRGIPRRLRGVEPKDAYEGKRLTRNWAKCAICRRIFCTIPRNRAEDAGLKNPAHFHDS